MTRGKSMAVIANTLNPWLKTVEAYERQART